MSRLHTDSVEVQRQDDMPAQFLWRGRLYLVQEVLSRWTQSGGWWRSATVQALSTGERAAADLSAGSGSLDDGEQDWFRVEAGCPPFTGPSSAGTGVFDLCFHWSSGRWTLARVQD